MTSEKKHLVSVYQYTPEGELTKPIEGIGHVGGLTRWINRDDCKAANAQFDCTNFLVEIPMALLHDMVSFANRMERQFTHAPRTYDVVRAECEMSWKFAEIAYRHQLALDEKYGTGICKTIDLPPYLRQFIA